MKILIVAGAGISADSGIPTYYNNSNTGLWNINDLNKICTIGKDRTKESFDFYNNFRGLMKNCNTNNNHILIQKIQQKYENTQIYTFNIDELLEASNCQNVVHLHGKINEIKCKNCNNIETIHFQEISLNHTCVNCGSSNSIRNNIVYYGEKCDYRSLINDVFDLDTDDLLIYIGSSNNSFDLSQIMKPLKFHKILINPNISTFNGGTSQYTIFSKLTEDIFNYIDNIYKK
jgi:NAD-dependent deacetylase